MPTFATHHPPIELARIAFSQLTDEPVLRIARLRKGWGHMSWTVRAPSGRYLIKTGIRRPHLADLYRQVAAQQHAAVRLATPQVIAISDHGGALQRPAYIQSWLDGRDGEVTLPRLSHEGVHRFGHDLGAAVAALHRIPGPRFAEDCAGTVTYATWAAACHARLHRVLTANEKASVLPAPALHAVTDRIAELIDNLPDGIEPRLTHRDLYLPNTLQLTGHQEPVGLLDWESAAYYDPVWDFVKLGMWVFDKHPQLRAPFMDGYTADSPLPEDFDERLTAYQGIEYLAGFPYFGAAWPDESMLDGFRTLLAGWMDRHHLAGDRP
ncbi:phosphotransferase family protein [Streptomyces sp. URMC 127]|uniref:phosphotransferase family protein n=1 Tax=Streptomyces sp. URMC 127 TaxID=3423402 RepID=UPI003F1D5814